jgi:hypothetical protein
MLASVQSLQLSCLIIAPSYMYTQNSTKKSWIENLALEGTLDHFLKLKLKSSLVPSNPHLFLLFLSLERWINIEPYIIFFFPHSPQDNISSINYSINSNLFSCTWGTFATLCTVIWHLPEGFQASICDVTEVYHCYIRNTTLDSDGFQMGFWQWAQPLSTFHFHSISNILLHSLTVAYSQPSVIAPIPAYCNRGRSH